MDMIDKNQRKSFLVILFSFVFLFTTFAVEQGIGIGQKAPDFKLVPVGGGSPVGLSSLKGKPVVLIFWAGWCRPCIREIPQLKEFYQKYSAKGVQFVSIAIGWRQNESDVARIVEAYQIPYQTLWDRDNEVAGKWAVESIPTNVIIDGDGVIRYRYYGLTSEAERILQSMVKPG